mgnify:CR=1 FL=1
MAADAAGAGVDGGMGIAASSAGVMISNTLTTFCTPLTERGQELEPVLRALAHWGSRAPLPEDGAAMTKPRTGPPDVIGR